MKILFLIVSTVILSTSMGLAQTAVSGTDIEGIYSGSVQVFGGAKVPLSLFIHVTGVETKGASNEFFGVKKLLQANFILDDESDPYSFTVADYQVDKGKFDFEYNRVGSTGATGSIVALRFEGYLQLDGSIKGTMTSDSNKDMAGTFVVERKSKTTTFLPRTAKYIGHWKGTITLRNALDIGGPTTSQNNAPNIASGQQATLDVVIDDVGSQSTTNNTTIETGTTPGRVGSFYFDGPGVIFGSAVNIDYLRQKIWLTYQSSLNVGNTIVSLQGILNGNLVDGGNIISGSLSSTGQGDVGTFKVTRVSQ